MRSPTRTSGQVSVAESSVTFPPVRGSAFMPTYRVYFIEPENRISRPPEVIECADDHEATDKAIGFVDGHDVEVWSLGRLVVRLPHNSSE